MIASLLALALFAQTDTSSSASSSYHVTVRGRRLAEAARADTTVRITRVELQERGVTNLAQAMDLITDTQVRPQGRGGYQVNIRGARKGSVLILIDGVPM